jgi:hypothetical protein
MDYRRIILLSLASLGAVCMLGVTLPLYELSHKPAYDQGDPDYRGYEEAFDGLRVKLDRRGTTEEDYVDLSMLNNGEWTTARLFGGYTMPLDEMRALGANISDKDLARITEAGSRGFRLAQVEEQEMAIAYIDRSNDARFIHFATGIGPEGQHLQGVFRPAWSPDRSLIRRLRARNPVDDICKARTSAPFRPRIGQLPLLVLSRILTRSQRRRLGSFCVRP